MLDWDVVIVGGGPAGLTAGLYLSRGRYRTLLMERESFGGQIKNVELLENFPGFSLGVAGSQLASEMVAQATKYGLQLEQAEVVGVELYSGCKCVQRADGVSYTAEAVVIAGGCQRSMLGVPGEAEFAGHGVSYCATCDGALFVDKPIAVVGGGNAAITEALELTKFATKVTVIHRRNELRATKILQEKAFANPKIEFLWDTVVEEVAGETSVNNIKVRNVKTREKSVLPVSGVFVDIGSKPNTDYLKDILTLDATGAIVTNDRMETNVPGVFAAGDIRSNSIRQAISATGDGAIAAVSIQSLLQS